MFNKSSSMHCISGFKVRTGVSGQACWNTKYQCGAIRDKDSTDRLTDAFWLQTPIALALFVVVGFFAVLPLKCKSIRDEWNCHATFVINSSSQSCWLSVTFWNTRGKKSAVTFLVLAGTFSSSELVLAATLFFDAAWLSWNKCEIPVTLGSLFGKRN